MTTPAPVGRGNGFGLGVRTTTVFGFACALLLSGSYTALQRRSDQPPGPQPIAFNHKKHVEQEGIECKECHRYVEKQAFSGLPTAADCASCHAEPQGKSAEEARLIKALAEKKPIVWAPLFRQPSHVFYSHRRHVVTAGIECTVCHGSIAATERPPSQVKKLRMNDCIQCHRRRGVSADCTTCHR